MNMQLRPGFARAKPIRLKLSQKKPDFSGFFYSKNFVIYSIWSALALISHSRQNKNNYFG